MCANKKCETGGKQFLWSRHALSCPSDMALYGTQQIYWLEETQISVQVPKKERQTELHCSDGLRELLNQLKRYEQIHLQSTRQAVVTLNKNFNNGFCKSGT